MKRIDSLTPGERVAGLFKNNNGALIEREELEFKGIKGSGDDRVAEFTAINPEANNGVSYDFGVYRFNKRWCYGTSAEPFSIAPLTF